MAMVVQVRTDRNCYAAIETVFIALIRLENKYWTRAVAIRIYFTDTFQAVRILYSLKAPDILGGRKPWEENAI